MMITLFSFFMAVVWSSLLIALTYCIRKTRFYLQFFGVSWLSLLYLLCALRMVLPLEFSYTTMVETDGAFARTIDLARTEMFVTEAFALNPVQLCFVIWMAVTALLLARLTYRYYRAGLEIKTYRRKEDARYEKTLKRIQRETGTNIPLSIRYSPDIKIPMSFGIMQKVILLPDIEYEEDALYYILLHEYTHFRNHDLLIKLLIHIFCRIFWWNPLVYLLQKDLSQTLEMKCDLVLCGNLKKQEKIVYLQSIVNVLKDSDQEKQRFVVSTAIAKAESSREMKERFAYIIQQHDKKQHRAIGFTIMAIFIVILFLVSYSFVIQPHYETPLNEIETDENAIMIESDEITVIKKKDGSYVMVHPYGEQEIEEDSVRMIIEDGIEVIEED